MAIALPKPWGPLGVKPLAMFFLHELLIEKLAIPWSVELLGMCLKGSKKEEIILSTNINLLVNEITLRDKIFSLANKSLHYMYAG